MNNRKCATCGIDFVKRSGLIEHLKRKHPNSTQEVPLSRIYKYFCQECGKRFINERNFNAHKRTHMNIPGKHNCPLCDFVNATRKQLINHFQTAHDILVQNQTLKFDNVHDFLEWKTQTEKDSHCTFVKTSSGYENREFKKIDYYCHRSGNYRITGTQQRNMKTQGSCKINGLCPATIRLYEYKNGKCRVNYMKTHVGHDFDLGHINLTADEKEKIAIKIAMKVPFDEILNEIRDTVTDSKLERKHLLTRKDLYNIEHAKLNDLRVRHVESETLSLDMVFPAETGWQVMCPSTSQIYMVQEVLKECQCKLSCSDCQNVCLHQYSCSCLDASLKWNMCQHIHLVCRYLQSSMATDTTKPDMTSESSFKNDVLIHVKEEKPISISEQEQPLLKIEIENFIVNFTSFVRNNVTTHEELELAKKLIAPVESTLTVLKQQKQDSTIEQQKNVVLPVFVKIENIRENS